MDWFRRKMWNKISFLLLLFSSVSQSANESDVIQWPSFSSDQPVVRASLEFGDKTASSTGKPINDAGRSEICQLCICHDEIPFMIDCSGQRLDRAPLLSDWPNDTFNLSIEARFDENQFTEITQYPSLPLFKLSYRSNAVQVIQKGAFKFLNRLQHLDLSENNLTHESLNANVFEGQFNEEDYEPLQIKTLMLGYNQIHSIDKDAFNHLSTHLETLELNNNPLTVIDHQTAIAITTLRKLKHLNLAETGLESIPDGVLHATPSLKVLILSGNRFDTVPSEIRRARNLEYLNLNANPITTFGADSFQGLTSLKELNVSAMPLLETIGINTFTPLTSMTHLWSSFNPSLRKLHKGAFNNMAKSDGTFQLREFHFRGNSLSTLPSSLLPWEDLQIVDLEGNTFVCDCRIGWIVASLLPRLAEKEPEMAHSVSCSGPSGYKDRALMDLVNDANITGDCTIFTPDNGDDNDSGSHSGYPLPSGGDRKPSSMTSFNMGLMVISLLAIALVIGGIACMALMAVRKSHLRQIYDSTTGQIVHYVRTPGGSGNKMDDEQAIVTREVNQYNDDP